MKYKKFWVLLITLLFIQTLCACAANSADDQSTAPTQPQFLAKIGVCLRQQSESPDYYQSLVTTLEAAGYQVTVKDSYSDQAKQLEQIRELAELDCQLLIVEPVMVTAAQELVELVKTTGLPLLLLDNEPDLEILNLYDKLSYLGSDPSMPGATQAQLLPELYNGGDMNGDGTVYYMILTGPEEHADAQLRTVSLNAALEDQSAQCLTIQYCPWSLTEGRAACSKLLAQYGRDIEVIFCGNDQLAVGAAEAVKNGGWVCGQDICVVGIGSSQQILESINQGMVSGTVAADHDTKCSRLLELTASLLAGEAVQKQNYVDFRMITPQTLAES